MEQTFLDTRVSNQKRQGRVHDEDDDERESSN
jgi:hypothetical protein